MALPYDYNNPQLWYIILHCTANQISICKQKDGTVKRYTHLNASHVLGFHMNPKPKGNGWDRPGYSKILEYDGVFNININDVRNNIERVLPQIEDAIYSNSLARDYQKGGKYKWVYVTESGSNTLKINQTDSVVFSTVDERKISGQGDYFDTILTNAEITYGAAEYNVNSVHISYIGGLLPNGQAFDTRSEKQKLAMETIIRYYLHKFYYKNPNRNNVRIKIIGHHQVHHKACPCYWTADWLRSIGIPEMFIDETDPFGYKETSRRANSDSHNINVHEGRA